MASKKHDSNGTETQPFPYSSEEMSKQLDDLNIKIIKALISKPDISSTEIAHKYNIPLSTIQRRRARIESSLLLKEYNLDISRLGWRLADLLISVEKGKAEETASRILQNSRTNVISASLRIGHPQVDIMARIFYRNSQELHSLTELTKSMPHVTAVEWAEVVKMVGTNISTMLDKVLGHSKYTT